MRILDILHLKHQIRKFIMFSHLFLLSSFCWIIFPITAKSESNPSVEEFRSWHSKAVAAWTYNVLDGRTLLYDRDEPENLFKETSPKLIDVDTSDPFITTIWGFLTSGSPESRLAAAYYLNRFSSEKIDWIYVKFLIWIGGSEGEVEVGFPRVSREGKLYGIKCSLREGMLILLSDRNQRVFRSEEDFFRWDGKENLTVKSFDDQYRLESRKSNGKLTGTDLKTEK